jgi:RimJ/RimL family protein N-acetyltransferase
MNRPDLMALLNRERPIAEGEHAQWFGGLAARDDCRFFAIERLDEGRHVGNVWLWDIDPRHRRAEVRIVIGDPLSTDVGIGSEAIRAVSLIAFEQLGLHKVYAYVLASNARAARAFEKAGFRTVGVLMADRRAGDRYVDVILLEALRAEA